MSDPPYDPSIDQLIRGGEKPHGPAPARQHLARVLTDGLPATSGFALQASVNPAWGPPYEPDASYPDGNVKWAVAQAALPPEEWLDFQYDYAHGGTGSKQAFLRAASAHVLDDMRAVLRDRGASGQLPMPSVFIEEDGTIETYQEGRHRGLAALHVGEELMPVWLAARNYR